MIDTERTTRNIRIREEETDIHNADNMDAHHDRRFLHRHVLGTYIHNWRGHSLANNILQGSHRHSASSESSQKSTIYPLTELVLFGDDHVLFIRRERNILLQAYRACG